MTDDTPKPLPGLPQPAPSEPRQLTDLETCTVNLQVSIQQLASAIIMERPDLNPADGAAAIGEIVAKVLVDLMDPAAARLGLLVAFEQAHEEPMSFIKAEEAKQALGVLATRRRARDRKTAGGVIIPRKD